MRKDSGFEVTDHIHVCYFGSDKLKAVIADFEEEIKAQLLAETIVEQKAESAKEWNINGEKVTISIAKA